MKKLFIVIWLTIFLHSCGESCNEYIIRNNTNINLIIIDFSKENIVREREVLAKDIFTESVVCSSDGGQHLGYFERDSIQVKSNEVLLKTYYPNDEGKSIYKTYSVYVGEKLIKYWKLVETKEHSRKFVFEITEDDLR